MEKLNTNTSRDGWHQTWYDGYLLPSDYDPDLQEEWTGILRHSRKIYFYFSSRVCLFMYTKFTLCVTLFKCYGHITLVHVLCLFLKFCIGNYKKNIRSFQLGL